MRLLANVDEEGNITNSLYGEFVIDPDDEYEHHIEITKEEADNIHDYKIIDGKLTNAK